MKLSHTTRSRRARTTIAVATAGLTAVLLAAIAYANTTAGAVSKAAGPANQMPAIIDHFAVLRSSESSAPPPELATAVSKAPASYGLQLAAARRSASTESWLVPGNGWLCIAARDADGLGMSCTSAASAEAGELTLSERSQVTGVERVLGACPDGYARVRALSDTDSGLGSAEVKESTYRLTVQNARQMALE